MKELRVTARVDEGLSPAFYTMLADSPDIVQTQVLEWNTTTENLDTVLFAIEGDPETFAECAPETPGIESVQLSATDQRWSYALVEARPLSTPLFDAIHRARTRAGLVVRKPIVYRDGDMFFRVVGDPEPLQTALSETPEAMDVRIDEIGRFRGHHERPAAALSERQREAVAVALDLGYYDRPRRATQADVAAELGCARQTASDHLLRAEAKLVRAAMESVDPQG